MFFVTERKGKKQIESSFFFCHWACFLELLSMISFCFSPRFSQKTIHPHMWINPITMDKIKGSVKTRTQWDVFSR